MEWFHELDRMRGSSGFDMSPLAPSDIKAWSELSGNDLQPWEFKALQKMDVARRTKSSELRQAGESKVTEVDATDAAGVRGVMSSLGAKKVRRAPKRQPYPEQQ